MTLGSRLSFLVFLFFSFLFLSSRAPLLLLMDSGAKRQRSSASQVSFDGGGTSRCSVDPVVLDSGDDLWVLSSAAMSDQQEVERCSQEAKVRLSHQMFY